MSVENISLNFVFTKTSYVGYLILGQVIVIKNICIDFHGLISTSISSAYLCYNDPHGQFCQTSDKGKGLFFFFSFFIPLSLMKVSEDVVNVTLHPVISSLQ